MDLALALGQPVGTLARTMTEGEFSDWTQYAAKRMLPARRTELYLAQIAMFIAQSMGGAKNTHLSDYMFDPDDDEAAGEATADDEAAFFDFRPRS